MIAHATQRYFAPGEVLLEPAPGEVDTLFLLRRGTVRSQLGAGEDAPSDLYGPGELLPVGALLARRAVRSTYRAVDDVFALALAADDVRQLAARSTVFAAFLGGQAQALLAKSREALQQAQARRALAEQTLETPLSRLLAGKPVRCEPATPLSEALLMMQERHVGSVLVTTPQGALAGILTRHDLPALMLQPDFSLQRPIEQVMHSPVHSLPETATAQDAALLMAKHGIRHVPVTRGGLAVGVVSERDLFTLQRASLPRVSDNIRRASDLPALQAAAADIRRLARQLLSQGLSSQPLTQLVSHLNDRLTQRLLAVLAEPEGIDLRGLCWVALGSEGRGEQTLATDQDNALVLPDDTSDAQLLRVRGWAARANEALDACGFPLCKGGIMAGQPDCCLRQSQWLERFDRWIDHGSPQDLLHAAIYFDLRPLAGDAALVAPLSRRIADRTAATPRFLHQLAMNALTHRPPLDWFGHIETDAHGAIDLKLQGAALFVDAARLMALAQGVTATGTRERLQASGQALGLAPREISNWTEAFDFLQGLRLRVQLDADSAAAHPNQLHPASLGEIDQRILAACLRQARTLQQRLALDWAR
ncbi:MAG: DUF294 nucleotidyltransferase-like domain-containing protein [Pseudomonadota bacterium]